MRRFVPQLLLPLACIVAQAPPTPPLLWVRLETAVNSGKGHTGAPVRAIVTVPYSNGSDITIPVGSVVTGHIESPNRERLGLEFQTLQFEGRSYSMRAEVAEIDNARERVLPDGTILALERLKKRPGKVEMVLLAAAYAHPAAIALVEGSKFALREVDRPSVEYPPGTDIALRVESWPAVPKQPKSSTIPDAPSDLRELLNAMPQRTETYESLRPSDWVNLAFAGSKDELEAAFVAAGWQPASRLSLRSDVKTFLALADSHAYKNAPVSRLLIAGKLPELVYQKQTNTFAKRHHIRIWSTDKFWQGRPVWIAAATHDIGIDFSTEAKTFTHRIASNVDLERQKVLNDLSFADMVRSVYVLPRPFVPRESHNATGDVVTTDGSLYFISVAGK